MTVSDDTARCGCATLARNRRAPSLPRKYQIRTRPEGRLHHRAVAPDQARLITQVMNDYQRLLALLEDWEHESARITLRPRRR